MKIRGHFFKKYTSVMEFLFFVFLFFTLSFGRAFSIFHINTGYFPAYVTEIFLFLNIPVLIYKYKESFLKIPRAYLTAILFFFCFACLYLFAGFYIHHMLALRDITISGYILFLFIAVIYLNNAMSVETFIYIFFLANFVNIFLGFCLLFNLFPQGVVYEFINKTKYFNVGLYYGISIALIVSLYEYIKTKVYRLCALVLLSLNAWLLFLSSQSSLWVALLLLIIFLIFVLRGRLLIILKPFLAAFILVGLLLYCVDPQAACAYYKKNIYKEFKSIGLFSTYAVQRKLTAKVTTVENALEQINEYQSRMLALRAAVNVTDDLKVPFPQARSIDAMSEVADNEATGTTLSVADNQAAMNVTDDLKAPFTQAGSLDAIPEVVDNEATGTTLSVADNQAAVKTDVDMKSLVVEYGALDMASRIENSLDNINWRLSIWKQTLRFGSGSPLIGKGFGAYPVYKIYASRQYPQGIYEDSKIVPAHNDIITIFFKMGILGLALFLFMNIYIFVYALRYIKKCNSKVVRGMLVGLLGSLVFWHVLAFLFDVIDSPPTSIWLWILMGSILAVVDLDKKKQFNRQELL